MREINESTATKEGIYEEMVDPDAEEKTQDEIEELIDIEEENEALDMDMGEFEEGMESTYDHQIEFESNQLNY